MSKRKNRNRAPNLPEETIARAREQAGLAPEVETEDEDEAAPLEAVKVEPVVKAEAISKRVVTSPEQRSSRRQQNRRRNELQQGGRRNKPLTSEEVEELLDNPTKIVTEDELRQQYGYVLADLRSMGMLAAGLTIVLIIGSLIL